RHCQLTQRHLPSFPTRRSSDLIIKWSDSPLWDEWTKLYTDLSVPKEKREQLADEFYKEHEAEMLEGTEVLWPSCWPYLSLMKIRSEEHTSELQSRENLVCRLLL